jgi:predicted exporter
LSSLVASIATQRGRRTRLDAIDRPARARAIRAGLEALGFDPGALDGFLSQLEAPFTPLRVRDLPDELGFLVRLHLHRAPSETRIASYLYPVVGAREAEALAAIEAIAKGPAGGVVTGKPLVEPALREAAERDLLHATLLAALLVACLVAAHYRRWRPTLAILLPLSLAWVGFGATLWLLRIPLNLYNLLAVPLVVGYGIDDHVFLLSRFEEQGHRDVPAALASTGRAVIVTSLATIAGFLPIAFARFPPLRLLGVSAALAVGWCLVAAFLVLPALLALLWKEDRS